MANADDLPTPREVLAIHDELEEVYDMKYRGVAVAAPKLKLRRILAEAAEYDGTYDRAAILLRKLLTSHLFEDGNKRTSWVVTREYLDRSGFEPAERDRETVVRVLKRIRRYDASEISEWLRTGTIDRDRLEP